MLRQLLTISGALFLKLLCQVKKAMDMRLHVAKFCTMSQRVAQRQNYCNVSQSVVTSCSFWLSPLWNSSIRYKAKLWMPQQGVHERGCSYLILHCSRLSAFARLCARLSAFWVPFPESRKFVFVCVGSCLFAFACVCKHPLLLPPGCATGADASGVGRTNRSLTDFTFSSLSRYVLYL